MEDDITHEKAFQRLLFLVSLDDRASSFDRINDLIDHIDQRILGRFPSYPGAVMNVVIHVALELLFVE